jgi:hypothetical protein
MWPWGDRQKEAPPAPTAGELYADLIKEQLKAEEDRKASIEQKGASIVTTAGALIVLFFGLAGFTTTAIGFRAEGITGWLLAGSLVAFLLAAAGGIATQWLFFYPVIKGEALTKLLAQSNKPLPPARFRVSQARIEILKGARSQNTTKGIVLTIAQTLQVLAILLAATAVLTIFGAKWQSGSTAPSPSPSPPPQVTVTATVTATVPSTTSP